MGRAHDLRVRVIEIAGQCPVYRTGQSFLIREGYILDTSESDDVCLHGLASVFPYYVALARGVEPADLGLSGPREGCAYVQCLDPCMLTGGGTVTFEIEKV